MKLIKYLLVVIFAITNLSVDAEELKKKVLAIGDFTYSKSFTKEDVSLVRNQIVKAVQNTGRVIVVDHNSEGINSRDLAYLKKHLIDSQNYAVQAEDADVNADGNVDILDFIRFKKKLVNLADFVLFLKNS